MGMYGSREMRMVGVRCCETCPKQMTYAVSSPHSLLGLVRLLISDLPSSATLSAQPRRSSQPFCISKYPSNHCHPWRTALRASSTSKHFTCTC